jgi:hypothetical protein
MTSTSTISASSSKGGSSFDLRDQNVVEVADAGASEPGRLLAVCQLVGQDQRDEPTRLMLFVDDVDFDGVIVEMGQEAGANPG